MFYTWKKWGFIQKKNIYPPPQILFSPTPQYHKHCQQKFTNCKIRELKFQKYAKPTKVFNPENFEKDKARRSKKNGIRYFRSIQSIITKEASKGNTVLNNSFKFFFAVSVFLSIKIFRPTFCDLLAKKLISLEQTSYFGKRCIHGGRETEETFFFLESNS